jgi:hypothetical protein
VLNTIGFFDCCEDRPVDQPGRHRDLQLEGLALIMEGGAALKCNLGLGKSVLHEARPGFP